MPGKADRKCPWRARYAHSDCRIRQVSGVANVRNYEIESPMLSNAKVKRIANGNGVCWPICLPTNRTRCDGFFNG
jgi:hypothetical protein